MLIYDINFQTQLLTFLRVTHTHTQKKTMIQYQYHWILGENWSTQNPFGKILNIKI